VKSRAASKAALQCGCLFENVCIWRTAGTLHRANFLAWNRLGLSGLCNMLETIVNHVQPARPHCRVVASSSMYVIVAPQADHTVQGESRELAWAIWTLQHIGSNSESCAASRAAVQSGLLFWRWCARLVHKQVWSRSWSSHIHRLPSWTAEHCFSLFSVQL